MNQPLIDPFKLTLHLRERIYELRIPPAVSSTEEMTNVANLAAANELEQVLVAAQAGEFDQSDDDVSR